MIPLELTEKFNPGQKVIYDDDQEVTVISQSPKRLFTKVTGDFETFDAMTYRLKPVKERSAQ